MRKSIHSFIFFSLQSLTLILTLQQRQNTITMTRKFLNLLRFVCHLSVCNDCRRRQQYVSQENILIVQVKASNIRARLVLYILRTIYIYIYIQIYNIKSLSSNENHDISYKVRMKAYQVQRYERKIVSKGEGKTGVRKMYQ